MSLRCGPGSPVCASDRDEALALGLLLALGVVPIAITLALTALFVAGAVFVFKRREL